MEIDEAKQAQIEGLATLLVLDDEIRKLSNIREFGFFATNESHRLIRYHTGFLWQKGDMGGVSLMSQSGTAEIDEHAPTNEWLKLKIHEIMKSPSAKIIHQVQYEQNDLDPHLHYHNPDQSEWPDTLPHYLLWCPFLNRSQTVVGGLLFFWEKSFSESEIKMMGWLLSSYQYAWQILVKEKRISILLKLKEKPHAIAGILVAIGVLLFPVRLSVLAKGTVVPKNPILINAPMQSVIRSFSVSPGEKVKAGQLLLTLDKTDLQSTAEVSQKEVLLTQAKLRTAISQGLSNDQRRSEVPILQAQLGIDKAHLDYTNELLKKADVVSPVAGIVIFDSKEDWVGQPVHTGERILAIADPKKVKLKIALPIADVIQLDVGASGEFYLYGKLVGLNIEVNTIGYNAKVMPSKILAYQLLADLKNKTASPPQLGAQGTVRLYGHRVPLIYYLFRRPLQAIRQTLGI